MRDAPRRTLGIVVVVSIFTAALWAPSAAPAQQQAGSQHTVQRVIRVIENDPRIGSAGTTVELEARLLPALTPVQVVIGATRSGFEGLALGQTNADGELYARVQVPEWSSRDQAHRFIVFNLYFSTVLAESAIFHVTDADGKVVRAGRIGTAGPGCATLEGDDGERYRLVGAEGVQVGDHVAIEGPLTIVEDGCGDGLSLNLGAESIARSPR